MGDTTVNKYKNKIFTIPNILSFARLCLIPFILWLYIERHEYTAAGILILISGFTDILDGFIARKFNMISDVGKVLDPVADKATQGAVMIALCTRYPLMLLPIILMVVKESFMAVSGYMIIKRCGVVLGADWYGKLATVMTTVMMALHIFWLNIIPAVSVTSTVACALTIFLALLLYARRNLGYLIPKEK